MTTLIVLALVAIVSSLGAALFFMIKGGGDGKAAGNRMARALAVRIGLSVLLFVCVLIAWKLGWIQPTGIAAGR